MPADKIEKESWNDEHTLTLLQSSIKLLLNNRPELYAAENLKGVSDNGGHRINQKLQQMLKKFCSLYPGGEGLVEEEVNRLKEARSKNGGNGGTPKSSPKKRKVKDEE